MAVLLALAVAWLYADSAVGLVREWLASADASYGIVLAAVAAAVTWQRRERFARAWTNRASDGFGGLLVLTGGLLLFLAGQLGADVFLTRISLVVVLAGAIWSIAGGAALRIVTAPLAFLAMAIPLPALVVNAATLPLQVTASQIAETTLRTAGVAVFRDGNVLELPAATLEVAQACSGLRSLVSLTAIAVLLAWAAPARTRAARAAIVAFALPVAIVMNGFRIAGIGLACEAWGPTMASGTLHTVSGWLTFLVSAIVLIAIQRRLAPQPSASAGFAGAGAAAA
jgi:exosortase